MADEFKIFEFFTNHKEYVVSRNISRQTFSFRMCTSDIHWKFLKSNEENGHAKIRFIKWVIYINVGADVPDQPFKSYSYVDKP